MIHRFYLRLDVNTNSPTMTISDNDPGPPASPSTIFTFEMCRKKLDLGHNRTIAQIWIDRSRLNPEGGAVGPEYHAIVDYFAHRCRDRGTSMDALSDQQFTTFMLARLYPFARKINLNRVINAASMSHKQHLGAVAELESLLIDAPTVPITSIDFRKTVEALLGPTVPQHEKTDSDYCDILAQLVASARADIAGGDLSLEGTIALWTKLRTKLIRHTEKNAGPLVMNILSAEARAAFSVCYSAFWEDLTHAIYLQDKNLPFCIFHKLWHTEMIWPDPDHPGQVFTLFAGNCFALHPASSIFIETIHGRSLLGDVAFGVRLGDQPTDIENDRIQQLLSGLAMAVQEYSDAHTNILSERRETDRSRTRNRRYSSKLRRL